MIRIIVEIFLVFFPIRRYNVNRIMNHTGKLIQLGLIMALLYLPLFPSVGQTDAGSQDSNLTEIQISDSFSFVPTDIKQLRKRLGLEPPPLPEPREQGSLGLGLSLGLSEYRGDLGGGTVKPCREFHLEYQWDESPYALRGGIARRELKDRAFSTSITSLDLITLYQLRKIKRITPYLLAGFGWLSFDGRNTEGKSESSGTVIIPLGGGVSYPIRDRLKLYLEGGYHLTASDQLDRQILKGNNSDGYWRIILGITHYPPEKFRVSPSLCGYAAFQEEPEAITTSDTTTVEGERRITDSEPGPVTISDIEPTTSSVAIPPGEEPASPVLQEAEKSPIPSVVAQPGEEPASPVLQEAEKSPIPSIVAQPSEEPASPVLQEAEKSPIPSVVAQPGEEPASPVLQEAEKSPIPSVVAQPSEEPASPVLQEAEEEAALTAPPDSGALFPPPAAPEPETPGTPEVGAKLETEDSGAVFPPLAAPEPETSGTSEVGAKLETEDSGAVFPPPATPEPETPGTPEVGAKLETEESGAVFPPLAVPELETLGTPEVGAKLETEDSGTVFLPPAALGPETPATPEVGARLETEDSGTLFLPPAALEPETPATPEVGARLETLEAKTPDSSPQQPKEAPQIARLPGEPRPPLPAPESKPMSLSELTEIKLPFESQLKINANLSLNASFGYAQWTKDKNREAKPGIGFSSGLSIDQNITAGVNGQIGERVKVNLDYNPKATIAKDKTKISIAYTGEPQEVVQEASFGDVNLTMPTQFIKYSNKPVFGLKGTAKHKDFTLMAIGSQTKGTSKCKEFKGIKAKMETITKSDGSFQRRKYYQLMAEISAEERADSLPIIQDSLEVLLGNQTRQFYEDHPDRTTEKITARHWEDKDVFLGNFYRLIPGEDYIVDYKTGILTFKRNIFEGDVMAVYFKTKDGWEYGTASSPILIKQTTEAGYQKTNLYEVYELRNRFLLGSEVKYLSASDLTVEIKDNKDKTYYDANKSEKKEPDEESYFRIFGLDKDNDGRIDKEALEYLRDEGLLVFPEPTPFDLTDANSTGNPFYQAHRNDYTSQEWTKLSHRSIYRNYTPPLEDEPGYSIIISYEKAGKAYTYSLDQMNIVEESESVYVDGEPQKRNIDYQINYDIGQITFLRDEDINEGSKIRVCFDAAGFIAKKENLVGLRGEYKPAESFSLGSTYIFKGTSADNDVPKVTATTPRLQVLDMNSQLNAVPGLTQALNSLNLPAANRLTLTADGEAAASFYTPSVYEKEVAIIDSLDGGGGASPFSRREYDWSLGSLPFGKRAMLLYKDEDESYHKPYSERPGPYEKKDYGPVQILNKEEDTTQKTEYLLALAYNSPEDGRWVSIMRCINPDGVDYSNNNYLKVWAKGLEEGEELWVDLGKVSEDADGQGGYQESVLDEKGDTIWNIGDPKTEQRDKDRTNILDKEDIGWEFVDQDNSAITHVGAGNYNDKKTPDSEDLDGRGGLNTEESYFSFQLTNGTEPDENGWVLYQIPRTLAVVMTDTKPDWTAVKYIRLRLKCKAGDRRDTPVLIQSIEMAKSTWIEEDTAKIFLSDKNNEANPNYQTTYEKQLLKDGWFRDLDKDTDKKDGALVINYHLKGNDSSYCYRQLQYPYSDYQKLVFWLYRPAETRSNTSFHFQFGTEKDDNFFRYTFPLSGFPEEWKGQALVNITDMQGSSTWDFPAGEWRRVIIDLDRLRTLMQDLAGTGGFSLGNSSFDYDRHGLLIKGKKPSLSDIKHLKLMVSNDSGAEASGEIWVNEIHLRELSEAVVKPTMAFRFGIKSGFDGWGILNWDSDYLGAQFKSIGGPAEGPQRKVNNNLNGRVDRIKFMPLDWSWKQSRGAIDPDRVTDVTGANVDESLAESKTVGFSFTPAQIPSLDPQSPLLKWIPTLSKTTYTQADNTTFERDTGKKKEIGSTKTLTGGNISFPLKWMPTVTNPSYTQTDKSNLKWDTGQPNNTNWSKKITGGVSLPFGKWTPTLSTTYDHTNNTDYTDTGEEKSATEEEKLTGQVTFPKYNYSYIFPKRLLGIPTGHSLSFNTDHNYSYNYNKNWKKKTIDSSLSDSDTIDQVDHTVTGSQSFSLKFSPVVSLSSNFSLDLSQNYIDSTRRSQGFEPYKYGIKFNFGTNFPFLPDLDPSFSFNGSYDETYTDPRTADPAKRNKDTVNTLTNLTFSTKRIDPRKWWDKLKIFDGDYTYKLDVKAAYKDMPDTIGLWSDAARVYKDYYRGRFLSGFKTTDELSDYRNSGSVTRNHTINTNWYLGIKRITACSLKGNSTRTESESKGTVTSEDNNSLEGNINLEVLSWVRKLPYVLKKAAGSSLNLSDKLSRNEKFSRSVTTARSSSHTPSIKWSLSWPNNLSCDTNMSWSQSKDHLIGKKTAETSYSWNGTHKTIIKKPGEVKMPGLGVINLKNDVNLTSALGWQRQRKEINGKENTKTHDLTLNVTGGYSIQANANGTLKITGKYHHDQLNSHESYYGLQFAFDFKFHFK
ncbi:MAG: hypothetical protein AB1797_08400 [bacterium]